MAENTVKNFGAAGFDAQVKRCYNCINVGGGYVDKYTFFQGSNITCLTIYIYL
jgi:hypothetical protein